MIDGGNGGSSIRTEAGAAAESGNIRMVGLDGLRAIAASMVFAHHLGRAGSVSSIWDGLDVGVMIFFALSGFVLYRPFLAGPVAIGPYAVRRIARIWPGYLLAAVGVSVFLQPAFLADPLGLATMTHTPLGVIWTLQLEVGFYCLLPVVARLVRDLPLRGRVLILAWLACVWLAVGSVAVAEGLMSPRVLAVWAFVPGMIVADLSASRPDLLARTRVLAVCGGAMILASTLMDAAYPDLVGGIGAAMLLPWFAALRFGRWSAFVGAAGAISFSLYLWHLPLVGAFGLLAVPLAIVVAAAAFLLVERPGMAIGRWLVAGARVDGGEAWRRRRVVGLPVGSDGGLLAGEPGT